MSEIQLWFNPQCSKCREARNRLVEAGAPHRLVRYLDEPRTRPELEQVLRGLGSDDPRAIARTSDPLWRELDLDDADPTTILDAMVKHPRLVQRPIAIHGEKVVVARPAERVNELL